MPPYELENEKAEIYIGDTKINGCANKEHKEHEDVNCMRGLYTGFIYVNNVKDEEKKEELE